MLFFSVCVCVRACVRACMRVCMECAHTCPPESLGAAMWSFGLSRPNRGWYACAAQVPTPVARHCAGAHARARAHSLPPAACACALPAGTCACIWECQEKDECWAKREARLFASVSQKGTLNKTKRLFQVCRLLESRCRQMFRQLRSEVT